MCLAPRALAPLVLTCEHASNRLPFPEPPSGPLREVLDSHWGWDIGAWALTRVLARRLRTSAVGGRWSRLLIDLNRRVDDPTLIRCTAEGLALPWNARVSPAEIERRMVAYHAPYHLEVDRQILRRAVRGVRPLLLSVHSFTPRLGRERRDFDIGILYDDHASLARRLAGRLREAGLRVRHNQPYSGKLGLMYAIDRHGAHHGLPCLELEVNQGLFDGTRTAERLGGILAPSVAALAPRG